MKETQSKPTIIFLLGFMGSGKTKTGSRAAKMLGYNFIDLDKYLEEKEGRSISKIFDEEGETYFRQKENEYLRKLINAEEQPLKSLEPFRRLIVAVGGGTPCFNNNMAWMLQHGKCIWLKVSEEELFERLKTKRDKRPLLRNLTDEELRDFIRKKTEEREKYYSQAQLIIKADGLKAKELVEKINASN